MKISILLILLLLAPIVCYGQTIDSQTQSFIQIEVRDSKGFLTAYIEGKPEIFLADQVIQYVEPKSQKITIFQDGKKFEKIQFVDTRYFSQAHAEAGYALSVSTGNSFYYILYFSHDGYPVFPGDSSRTVLTILRLVS